MGNILKEIESIFSLISSIPVKGDAIDLLATARHKLRAVHAELKKQDMEANGKGAVMDGG